MEEKWIGEEQGTRGEGMGGIEGGETVVRIQNKFYVRSERFLLKIWTRTKMSALTTFICIVLGVLARAIRQQKEKKIPKLRGEKLELKL